MNLRTQVGATLLQLPRAEEPSPAPQVNVADPEMEYPAVQENVQTLL